MLRFRFLGTPQFSACICRWLRNIVCFHSSWTYKHLKVFFLSEFIKAYRTHHKNHSLCENRVKIQSTTVLYQNGINFLPFHHSSQALFNATTYCLTQLHRLFSDLTSWHREELSFYTTSLGTWRSLGNNEEDRPFGRTPHSGHLGVTEFLLPLVLFALTYVFLRFYQHISSDLEFLF